MVTRALWMAAGMLALAACAADDEGAASSDNAFTADAGADVMHAVWTETDYLPWEYAPDGCFARSFYVSMELVARGVPASQEIINLRWEQTSTFRPQFAPVDPRQPALPPVRFAGKVVNWDYHIAALLLPPVVPEPTILDRALEPGPVPLATWVGHANAGASPQPVSTVSPTGASSAGFNQFSTFGSKYVGVEPSLAKNWASVSSPDLSPGKFPHFSAKNIQLACDTIFTVHDCLKTPESDPRRARLAERTNELLWALENAKLLDDWDEKSITCGHTNTFTCAP
jgi:hypothetical protein